MEKDIINLRFGLVGSSPKTLKEIGFEKIENGKLGDVAPTILQIMGVEIPNEMTGNILIK